MSKPTPPGFAGLPTEFRDPLKSDIVVLPVPYDLTSSWKKGADKGPAVLIAASANMELYDIPTRTEVYRHGIHTLEPIIENGPPEQMTDRVDQAVDDILQQSKFPVVLGGEHSVSIGAIRAAARKFDNMTVLQIDAHGDTRDAYDGSKFNHACVMARAREWCTTTQVGIRAIDVDEVPNMQNGRVFYGHEIEEWVARGDDSWMNRVIATLDKHVYITIDLDAFDASLMPATGTPEPGGMRWREVNELVDRVAQQRNIVGFDVVELLPTPGQWASEFLAAKLVYRVLSMVFAHRQNVISLSRFSK